MNHAQLRHLEDVREFWEWYDFPTSLGDPIWTENAVDSLFAHVLVGEPDSTLGSSPRACFAGTYANRGGEIVLLLCGGDKASQARDIASAKQLARTEE
jgi:hypothetical protein